MKAVRFHRYGDSDVLTHEEADRPVAGPGQVVVKVAGTSFNPVDAAIRAGYLRGVFPVAFPGIPGIDVSGTIADIGLDVTDVDRRRRGRGGAADERRRDRRIRGRPGRSTPPRHPARSTWLTPAALPAVGLTAYQALFDHASLAAGHTVLVNGAGGAVGGYAVQLATAHGATVTATASPRSADRVRGYGAGRRDRPHAGSASRGGGGAPASTWW